MATPLSGRTTKKRTFFCGFPYENTISNYVSWNFAKIMKIREIEPRKKLLNNPALQCNIKLHQRKNVNKSHDWKRNCDFAEPTN